MHRQSPRSVTIVCALALALAASCTRPPDLDATVLAFMTAEGIPGGVLAASHSDGRSMVRAWGFADPSTGRPVRPVTPFRLASLSKPLTAAAVGALVRAGRLRVTDQLVDVLGLPPPADARARLITIGHLLSHTAGWDRSKSFDPLVDASRRRQVLGDVPASECGPVALAMWQQPLENAPGTAYAYSNLGYCFLQLVVARVTGGPYEAFVRDAVLKPSGALDLHVGEDRFDAAVLARAQPTRSTGAAPLPPAMVAFLGGAGGWVGRAPDYLGWMATMDAAAPAVPPPFPVTGPNYYGHGWRIWPRPGGGHDLTHFGAMEGTFSLAIRTREGLSTVAVFNARPADDQASFDRLRVTLPAAVMRALADSR